VGIGFPPEDWGNFSLTAGTRSYAAKEQDIILPLAGKSQENSRTRNLRWKRASLSGNRIAGNWTSSNWNGHAARPSATNEHYGCFAAAARQVARLIADAKRQISAAAREAAAQAVTSEQQIVSEKWQQKFTAAHRTFQRNRDAP